jgi:hypothetical protein
VFNYTENLHSASASYVLSNLDKLKRLGVSHAQALDAIRVANCELMSIRASDQRANVDLYRESAATVNAIARNLADSNATDLQLALSGKYRTLQRVACNAMHKRFIDASV